MASVDWGPRSWKEESDRAFEPKERVWFGWNLCHLVDTCMINSYAKAAANTMVIGRALAFLAKQMEPEEGELQGTLYGAHFKAFCMGRSLGGHVCGFVGKHYRQLHDNLFVSLIVGCCSI